MVTFATGGSTPKYWSFGRSVDCTSGIYLPRTFSTKLIGMTRPPIHSHTGKVVGALLLLVSLTIMVGCQGVSAGNSNQDPGNLDFGNTTLDFGSVAAGTSQTLSITATNSQAQAVTISSVAVTTKYFTLVAPSLPVTVSPGQTVTFSMKFSPDAIGSFNAVASVTSDATNAITNVALSGTGTANGQLVTSGASGDFGGVSVGSSQSQTVTLTNNGATSVNLQQVSISGAGFALTGITTPMTLNASQSTTFSVTFAPTTGGGASGTVTIASDASNPVLKMGLTGSGVSAGVLGSTPTSLSFGTVPVGVKQTLSETLMNTGSSSITISQVAIAGGSGFSMTGLTAPFTVAAGQSASFSVSFQPTAPGAVSGSVTITSNASNSTLTIPFSGTGAPLGPLVANPASLNFGNVAVGVKQTLSETVTNSGGSSVTISQAAISGGSGFSMSGITAPLTLTAGQSATFSVSFTPTAGGAVSGAVTITSNASNSTLTIALSGAGASAGPLAANPSSVNFGSVEVGVKQTVSETVTNTGGSSVTISQVAIAGGAGFSMTGITAPITLAGGQSATFSVSFMPAAAGAVSGVVTITSNASNSSLAVPLSGTGVAQGALGSNPTSLSFGSVPVGVKQTLSETVTNTGGSSITISQVAAGGTGFSVSGITTPATLAAGQSATFSVSFTPAAAGAVTGNVAVTSTASNPTLNIPLSGTGVAAGALGSNPTSLSFGSVVVGVKQTLSETLTNTGGSSVTISAAAPSGSGFSLTGITTPLTLTAGQSTTFSVSFTPTAAGAVSGNVAISSTASNPTLNIPLSGTGTAAGALTSNPTSLSFGSVAVGVKQTLSETVTNTGGSSVTISAATATGSGFSLTGITTPLTLTAGQSTTFSVSFMPTAAVAASGNVAITSTASNPTLNIPLSGTGVAAGALGANPTSLSFGSVQIAHTLTLSETLTNTGSTSISISQVSVTGTGFSVSGINPPVTLTAGQSTSFSVSFTPASSGAKTGTVTVTSTASNPTLNIPLSGTGTTPGTLVSNPTSLSFGNVPVSTTQTLSETITNAGGSSATISQVAASGTGFSVSGISTPVTLNAGQSVTFSVSFTPPSAGAVTGDVTITSNASDPTFVVPLSGTGTATAAGQLTVAPTTLALGSVQVGESGTGSGTLTASGANVTVTAASSTNAVFSISGLSLPVTIPAGQSASFTVTFSPAATGAVSGTLTFTSNAQPSATAETVTGTGTPAPTHSVSLSWTASTSSNVSGYNIYRAVYTTACGGFSKINPTLNAGTAYTDATVTNGTSYCYAATAVDSNNAESGYSNIVSNLLIP